MTSRPAQCGAVFLWVAPVLQLLCRGSIFCFTSGDGVKERRGNVGNAFVLSGLLVMALGTIVFCVQVLSFLYEGVWTELPGTYFFYVRLPENDADWSGYLTSRGFTKEQIQNLSSAERTAEVDHVRSVKNLLEYIPHGLMQDETWWPAPESAVGFHSLLTSVLDTLGMSGVLLVIGFIILLAGLYLL